MDTKIVPETNGDQNPDVFVRLVRFVLCILACLVFIFLVGPALDKLNSVKPLINFIEERGIDAGALYYTEIEEFSEANINMENTRDYPPKGPLK